MIEKERIDSIKASVDLVSLRLKEKGIASYPVELAAPGSAGKNMKIWDVVDKVD